MPSQDGFFNMGKYTGWIILGTLVFYLVSLAVPSLWPVTTFFAWAVPFLMWQALGKNARSQTLLLLSIGLTAILFSAARGNYLGIREIFAVNLPLLAMFVAVSFLSLTNPELEGPALPKGKGAVVTTALGTHLLGSVINLSVLFVFGDRLQKSGTLSRVQMIILGRSFCAAAWWSPFFIATGVALTYAPAMSWQKTLIPGIIMSAVALSYSIVEVCAFRKAEFSGYPLKAESLVVPLFLAALVIGVHTFLPDVSILNLICMLAPVGSLVFMKGRPRMATLYDFIKNRTSSVSSQFALFLGAGVFSTGIKSTTHLYPALFSFGDSAFTPWLFAILLGVMICIGIIGVHPVVSIAILSPLLMPLNVNHSQMGFLFLSSWAISTGCSPLSGVGLALTSRYQVSPRDIFQSNWRYAVAMWGVASFANLIFFVR